LAQRRESSRILLDSKNKQKKETKEGRQHSGFLFQFFWKRAGKSVFERKGKIIPSRAPFKWEKFKKRRIVVGAGVLF